MQRIEFIGIPGSGKTTIRKNIVKRIKNIGETKFLSIEEAILEVARKKIDKVYRVILKTLPKSLALIVSNKLLNRNLLQYNAQNTFFAKWGKSFEVFLKSSAFAKMPVIDREIVISGFIEIGSLYECINGYFSDETVVLFEEGFIQKSFMFISPFDNEFKDKTEVFNYLESIPHPDLVIYVNIDFASCYERMLVRPTGLTKRLKKQKQNDIMRFLENSDNHLQNIVWWLKRHQSIKVLEVNSDQILENTICVLEQNIKALFTKK